jgi:hypothetical protein
VSLETVLTKEPILISIRLQTGEKTTFKGKVSYSTSSSNRVQQGSNLSGLLLGLYRTAADFDNRDYIGTNYTSSGIATLEAIEAIERFRYHRNIYKPYL